MSIRKLLFIFITCPVFAENVNLNWVVDNETYANTTCSYGNDVNLPAPPQKSGYTFVGWKVQNYIPVEYIEIAQQKYIDTLIGPADFTYPIIEMRVRLDYYNNYNFVVVTDNTATNTGIGFAMVYNVGNATWRYSLTYGRASAPFEPIPGYNRSAWLVHDKKIMTYRFGGNEAQTPIYVDDKLVATAGDSVPDFSQLPITDTVRLTGMRSNTTTIHFYSFKISDIDGTVLFDGVPAKDLSGKPCMYDLVTNKCFYAGAGNITAGPEIE